MRGLLLKELYVTKAYMKAMLGILACFILISVSMKTPYYIQGMMSFYFGMLTFTGFSYDKMAGWDMYCMTMPVSRKDVVCSKYMICGIYCLFGSILGSVLALMVQLAIHAEDCTALTIFATAGLLFLIVLIGFSFTLPMIFKFGVEKARFMGILAFIPFLFLILFSGRLAGVTSWIDAHMVLTVVILVAVTCLIFIASICLSIKIYEDKEE